MHTIIVLHKVVHTIIVLHKVVHTIIVLQHLGEEAMLDYEQNTSDAMAIFHKLQTGLDVNVRFSG